MSAESAIAAANAALEAMRDIDDALDWVDFGAAVDRLFANPSGITVDEMLEWMVEGDDPYHNYDHGMRFLFREVSHDQQIFYQGGECITVVDQAREINPDLRINHRTEAQTFYFWWGVWSGPLCYHGLIEVDEREWRTPPVGQKLRHTRWIHLGDDVYELGPELPKKELHWLTAQAGLIFGSRADMVLWDDIYRRRQTEGDQPDGHDEEGL